MTEITVADSTGFPKGSRIKITHGSGAGETLVLMKVEGNTFTTRKYYLFDRWHDEFIIWYRGVETKFLDWWYPEEEEDYDEELD